MATDDELAAGIYAEALAEAHTEADPSERERAALTRFGDRSGSEALREAIDAFLGRTEWGATVRKWADAERSRLEAEYWQAAERDEFDALAVEVAVTYPVADVSGSPEADGAGSGAASAAEGNTAEALRLESLLRQLEYQAGLAAARGERPIDTEWLRTELGLTAPLSERLP
jgi:hypothetical protein